MKKLIFIGLVALGLISIQWHQLSENKNLRNEQEWLISWLKAWELINVEVLLLPFAPSPEMAFFDESFVYTTSHITAPKGEVFQGPHFQEEQLLWKKALHKGKVVLPDGQGVPVQLMSFAGPLNESDRKAYFVMAAPIIWEKSGVKSKELGLEKLMTGVFLHEFAHTRQVDGFGALLNDIEKRYGLEKELNDNIIQEYFSEDSIYIKHFKKETEKFYAAALAEDINEVKKLTREGLGLLKERQENYFTGNKRILKELDGLFLSMEGLGQYLMYTWLIHPDGGNLNAEIALKGTRRGGKIWSQEEGLALFIILGRLSQPDYANDMFGANPKSIIELLGRELKKQN